MRRADGWEVFALGLGLFALACILRCVNGCSDPKTPVRAVDAVSVASYATELDACLDQGKDAGSRAVYFDCAKRADVKYGKDGGM